MSAPDAHSLKVGLGLASAAPAPAPAADFAPPPARAPHAPAPAPAPPPALAPAADPVENMLRGVGLGRLYPVFDDEGWDDIDTIKESFGAVKQTLADQGATISPQEEQALRERLGLAHSGETVQSDLPAEVQSFLQSCGLQKYAEKFHEEGFDDVGVIKMYVDDVVAEIDMDPADAQRFRDAAGPSGFAAPEPQPAPMQAWSAPPAAAAHPVAPGAQVAYDPSSGEPWDAAAYRLTQSQEWRWPTPAELNTANEILFGRRLVVKGEGEGVVQGFEKKAKVSIGHSMHVINFSPLPAGVKKVSLKKKNNNETPWLLSNMCSFCEKRPQHPGGLYCSKGCKGKAKAAGYDRLGNKPRAGPQPGAHQHPSQPSAQPAQAWAAPLAAAAPAPAPAQGYTPAPAAAYAVPPAGSLGQPPQGAAPTPLSKWLDSIQLTHHHQSFLAKGYDDLDDLKVQSTLSTAPPTGSRAHRCRLCTGR